MASLSIVIPTFDSASYLKPLWQSIVESPLSQITKEIIFVSEGDGDNSQEVISEIAKISSIPVINFKPPQRLGKFRSRYEGTKLAKSETVMLVDSRVIITPSTAAAVSRVSGQFDFICAHVDINENKNIYCLYWARTHRRIFHRNFVSENQIIQITKETFDQYTSGTTMLIVKREPFLKSCEKFLHTPMFSDDTRLLKDLCDYAPITIHPEIRIDWEPRNDWWKFLKHLYNRGPGFAEYHVFEHRGWLFYLVLTGFVGLVLSLILLITFPKSGFFVFACGLFALYLSTAFFVKSVKEFFLLAPLHTMSLIYYGLGALNGTRVVFLERSNKTWNVS